MPTCRRVKRSDVLDFQTFSQIRIINGTHYEQFFNKSEHL